MDTGKQIIIVENDRATMLMYQKMVAKLCGWKGSFFSNFDDALRDMVNHQYYIIISNRLTASKLNGDDFLKMVSMIQPNSLRILISSSKEPVDPSVIHMFIEKNNFSIRELHDMLQGLEPAVC